MSLNLEKETVNLSEVFSMQYTNVNAESDVIVPDIKPDISKVLEISGTPQITQQNIQQDKLYVQGVVKLTVLYIPDSDILSGVRSMNVSLDFSHLLGVPGAKPDMKLSSETEIENISFSLINGRKINIRCKIGLSLKVSIPTEIQIPICVTSDTAVQTKKCDMKLMPYLEETVRDVVIRKSLEVPNGKSDIAEVLKITAKPQNVILSAKEGGVKLSGDMDICTLYCGIDENSPVMFMQHCIPLDEELEIDGVNENSELEGEYKVFDIYCEIQPDSDGDNRILGVEIVLKAVIKPLTLMNVSIVDDAYSLNSDTEIVKKDYKIEQLIDKLKCEETAKLSAEIPDYLPEVSQICDCNFGININNVNIEDGRITLYGTYVIRMLYISENSDAPVSGFEHTSSFEHIFETSVSDTSLACDAQAEPLYIGYTITSSRNVEFRLKSGLRLTLFKTGDVKLIDEINIIENSQTGEKSPSIVIYFAQNGDTVWDIAKRYKATPESIRSTNNITDDNLKNGQRIFLSPATAASSCNSAGGK